MSQVKSRRCLGMSQTGYSKYETGENSVPAAVLDQLADFYGTSVDYLLGRTDQPEPYPKKIARTPETFSPGVFSARKRCMNQRQAAYTMENAFETTLERMLPMEHTCYPLFASVSALRL